MLYILMCRFKFSGNSEGSKPGTYSMFEQRKNRMKCKRLASKVFFTRSLIAYCLHADFPWCTYFLGTGQDCWQVCNFNGTVSQEW